MKKYIYILSSLLILFSCKPKEILVPYPVKQISIERVIYKDTTTKVVLIQFRDSVSLIDTTSYLRNQYAESYANFSNGRLNHSLNMLPDSVPVKAQYIDHFRVDSVPYPVEVPKIVLTEQKLSKWESFKIEVGGWAIGVLSGILILGVIFGFLKLKKII